MTTNNHEALRELILDLQTFLEYQQEVLGVTEIPLSERKTTEEVDVKEKTMEIEPEKPAISDPEKAMEAIRQELENCGRCKLCEGRKNIVFGSGNVRAKLVFVGEAPGRDEDIQGLPFVGRAGQLLTKIIESIGLSREDVYIANIIKCRPPGNRNPLPEEIASCLPYLLSQLEVIQPEIICALGKFSAQTLTGSSEPIGRLRGKFYDFRGIKLIPTFHPAYLLRNPQGKKQVWEDMKMIRRELELLGYYRNR
jgi:DNA polymerase